MIDPASTSTYLPSHIHIHTLKTFTPANMSAKTTIFLTGATGMLDIACS